VRSGDGVDDDVEGVACRCHLAGVGGVQEIVCAEPEGIVALLLGAADDGRGGAECHGQLDREVTQAAEPGHGDATAGAHTEGTQRFPDGDAGAHQRGGCGRVEAGGERVGEAVPHDVLAGEGAQGGRPVPPVGAAVGESREGVAEVLLSCSTHGTGAAGVHDIAHRDAIADREGSHLGPGPGHHTSEFVTGHQRRFRMLVMVAQGVQVGVAHAAVVDSHRQIV
jgi:hypothetical protein